MLLLPQQLAEDRGYIKENAMLWNSCETLTLYVLCKTQVRWQTIAPESRNCVVICLLGIKINNWNWKRYFFASANVMKTSGFISWEDQIPMWRNHSGRNQLKAFLNFIWLFVLANLQQKRERLMHCCLRCTLMWQPGENIEGRWRLRFFLYKTASEK